MLDPLAIVILATALGLFAAALYRADYGRRRMQ